MMDNELFDNSPLTPEEAEYARQLTDKMLFMMQMNNPIDDALENFHENRIAEICALPEYVRLFGAMPLRDALRWYLDMMGE